MAEAGPIDMHLLARAPCWVFVVVAAADGKVDDRERRRFDGLLGQGDQFRTEWMRTALAGAASELDPILSNLDDALGRARADLETLADEAEARLEADEALDFKRDLLSLGKTIAEASGGILGFGEKIDDSEVEAIGHLADILRYRPS